MGACPAIVPEAPVQAGKIRDERGLVRARVAVTRPGGRPALTGLTDQAVTTFEPLREGLG